MLYNRLPFFRGIICGRFVIAIGARPGKKYRQPGRT